MKIDYECITKDELFECADADVEIACHSANHTNDLNQIIKSIDYLQNNLKKRLFFPKKSVITFNVAGRLYFFKTGSAFVKKSFLP